MLLRLAVLEAVEAREGSLEENSVAIPSSLGINKISIESATDPGALPALPEASTAEDGRRRRPPAGRP